MDSMDTFYTPDEVATRLGFHVRTIRRFIHEGRLKASRVGKQFRISEKEVAKLLGTKSKVPSRAEGGRRRITASTTIDIHSISKKEYERLLNLLLGAFKSPKERKDERRFSAVYYEEEGRLRVLVNADVEVSSAILGLIRGVVEG